MKNNDTSKSSQSNEPKDVLNIQYDNKSLNNTEIKFIKIKKPQNNEFIDKKALLNNKNQSTSGSNSNTAR